MPFLASGGIADGRSMAAALALGADGVNVGTRFMLTRESAIHDGIKQALLKASERDTALLKRTLKRSARYFANDVAREVLALEHRPGGASYEDLADLLSGRRNRMALETGEVDAGLICASQVIGLVEDIPDCAELVSRMVAECRASLQTVLGAFHAETCHV